MGYWRVTRYLQFCALSEFIVRRSPSPDSTLLALLDIAHLILHKVEMGGLHKKPLQERRRNKQT